MARPTRAAALDTSTTDPPDAFKSRPAATYAKSKIRFNAVAPGLVRTPLTKGLVASELAEKASVGMHPLGRLGEPEDVARAIVFLLDPAQGWITGQVLGVDGGLADLRGR